MREIKGQLFDWDGGWKDQGRGRLEWVVEELVQKVAEEKVGFQVEKEKGQGKNTWEGFLGMLEFCGDGASSYFSLGWWM